MSLYKEYLFYQTKYTKKYGSKTVIFMQVGSFYELYSTESTMLQQISNLLNIVLTKKDKSQDITPTNNNYYMSGFPVNSLTKYLNILIANNYYIVMIDQTGTGPSPKRVVTNIYSKATYLDNIQQPSSNQLLCIYLEEHAKKVINIGLSSIDVSTGASITHESFSTLDDLKFSLDETSRFINNILPVEILIFNTSSLEKDKLIAYLELNKSNYKYFNKVNPEFSKIAYQNEFFKKVFNLESLMSPIEDLDLESKIYSRISYVLLLDHAYQHNNNIITNLSKPVIYEQENILLLENNSISQLNIFPSDIYTNNNLNKNISCLLDVINHTSTSVGYRYLKHSLSNPNNDIALLNNKYLCIEECIKDKLYLKLETNLNNITDTERLVRKMSLNVLHPIELDNLINSFNQVQELVKITQSNIKLKTLNVINVKKLNSFLEYCNNTFVLEELKKYIITDIKDNFFKLNIYPDVDKIQNQVNNCVSFMDDVCNVLSDYLDEDKEEKDKSKNKSKLKDKNKEENKEIKESKKLYLKYTDREGYYIQMTKLRSETLKKNLKNIKELKIKTNIILTTSLTFTTANNITKLFITNLTTKSDELIKLQEQLSQVIKLNYIKTLTEIYTKYKDTFIQVNKYIAIIDFIKSGAKCAILYNYIKPIILNNNSNISYITATSLRHPIIERIIDTEYIPHDISLGRETSLLGIYGYNSAGKTSLMKSIGISIIMAQCGLYVPATNFTYFPYNKLFSRITSNDNLFKGMSSFILELSEIKNILKRTDKNSLIVSDELCRGTEFNSACALLSATLVELSKTNASFIFSSHLHLVAGLKVIKELKNLKIYHLTVNYDKEKDLLIFDRKLKLGEGPTDYGLIMAKYILNNDNFIKLAQEIKNDILLIPNVILNTKKSSYNSQLYIDKCSVCNKQNTSNNFYETHHIEHQKDCDENDFVINKQHIKKNNVANLVALCNECHDKVHQDKITISKYEKTSKGKKLKVVKN
jgi:DNA mismatch repair protein MutS